jgi:hypothetical protein
VEIPDDGLPLLITALEHYAAYARAVRHDDRPYRELAELRKHTMNPSGA